MMKVLTAGYVIACCLCVTVTATEYRINPDLKERCEGSFSRTVKTLKPGDTLFLGAGRYSQSCVRQITVNGTKEKPITIVGGFKVQQARDISSVSHAIIEQPVARLLTHNNLEIVDSHYLRIQGVEFSGGSLGVRILGGHHITIENSWIHHTASSAVTINKRDSHHVTLKENEISDTGKADGSPGEGIYIGCHSGSCTITDSIIEGNFIHSLSGDLTGGNDGIEIKPGSGGNVVRNNTVKGSAKRTDFPCIFTYGNGDRLNLIEANTLINCTEAIRVASDALVRNNLVLNSSAVGIISAPHKQVPYSRNVRVINNTIVGGKTCAILKWRASHHMIFANNALYCKQTTALAISGADNGLLMNNAFAGTLSGITFTHAGLFPAGSLDEDLNITPPEHYAPTRPSRLRRRAELTIPGAPLKDFYNRPRDQNGFATVGAIE